MHRCSWEEKVLRTCQRVWNPEIGQNRSKTGQKKVGPRGKTSQKHRKTCISDLFWPIFDLFPPRTSLTYFRPILDVGFGPVSTSGLSPWLTTWRSSMHKGREKDKLPWQTRAAIYRSLRVLWARNRNKKVSKRVFSWEVLKGTCPKGAPEFY